MFVLGLVSCVALGYGCLNTVGAFLGALVYLVAIALSENKKVQKILNYFLA